MRKKVSIYKKIYWNFKLIKLAPWLGYYITIRDYEKRDIIIDKINYIHTNHLGH